MNERQLSLACLTPTAFFIAALGVIVTLRLVLGQIRVQGLLIDQATGKPSAAQLQLLLASLAGAITYAATIAKAERFDTFPPVSTSLLALVAGSNAFLLLKEGIRQLIELARTPSLTKEDP